MALPSVVDPVKFKVGDPLIIRFFWIGLDLSDKTFVSHIKADPDDTSFIPFTTNCYFDAPTNTTWLELSLTGDTGIGELDGQTRDIPLEAVYDVQPFQGATQEPTLFTGTLEGEMDVTR